MRYIQGQDRNQINLFPVTLEEAISADNTVRDIDSFVNSLNLEELGFKHKKKEHEGRPPYRFAKALYLWISKSHTLIARIGERDTPQH